MATLQTEALVLRAVDFGESDRIVHLLTPRTGRLTVIAKGARRSVRRFPGTLDFFNRLRVQVDRRKSTVMARLEHARLIGNFETLRTDPARFALGCYLLELLDRLAPEDGPATDMAELFRFALRALEIVEATAPDWRVRTLLELRALDALGLRPELRCCVRCGEPVGEGRLGFHVSDGGPVCGRCARPEDALIPVHLGTLRALEQSLSLDLTRLSRLGLEGQALREARLLVGRFERFHVGLELRSASFLDQMLADRSPAAV